MRNDVRNVGDRGHEESLGILLFLIARPLMIVLGLCVGVLLLAAGFNLLLALLISLVPSLYVESKYADNMKEKIERQKQLYTFNPSTDISWNIEKHKEYKIIRKSELKWWEFWL